MKNENDVARHYDDTPTYVGYGGADEDTIPPEAACAFCGSTRRDDLRPYEAEEDFHWACNCCAESEMHEAYEEDARLFAQANCKLTHPLARCDGVIEERVVDNHNRHVNTNYDALLRPLPNKWHHDVKASAYYQAIRARMRELLEEAPESAYEVPTDDEE